jgi:pyruvate-formate lyase-activating enzyme
MLDTFYDVLYSFVIKIGIKMHQCMPTKISKEERCIIATRESSCLVSCPYCPNPKMQKVSERDLNLEKTPI